MPCDICELFEAITGLPDRSYLHPLDYDIYWHNAFNIFVKYKDAEWHNQMVNQAT